jgi:hypothetical protein
MLTRSGAPPDIMMEENAAGAHFRQRDIGRLVVVIKSPQIFYVDGKAMGLLIE